ncbi:hypothetical protein D7Z54_30820 [Salibacterium salarium]|uniref:LiaF transmembrane domain-containing protein n=1 Tax=Salibacterium salarium TaxID=284579 RepID=A0A3R9P2C3_9BACI|nr:hypothetical protein [Salibacterium salarium]RSL29511.1 hypothetical protein D7Z54_30820 [Salibacterium salarium]
MMRNSGNFILGFIIVVFGLDLLLNAFDTGIHVNIGVYIWPLIAALISYHFYKNGNKWFSLLFLAFCILSLGNTILDFDLSGILFALVLLYFGFKLMKRQSFSKEIDIDKDLPPVSQETTPHKEDKHITEASINKKK